MDRGGVPPLSLALRGGSLLYSSRNTETWSPGSPLMRVSEQIKRGLGPTAPAWS